MGGPEPVLQPAQHPEPAIEIALEVEHDIDRVLEQFGPGDAAVLGDMADEHHRDPGLLGSMDQAGRRLAHLGHPPGGAADLAGVDGLDRVHDEQVGPMLRRRRR